MSRVALDTRARVLGLGEALLRLSAPGRQRLEHAQSLEAHVGGAELNALIAASALGLDATFVTRLADNPLGRRIAAHAATYGVRALVDWDEDTRAPVYFVEHGAPPRPSEVLYDRDATAMRALEAGSRDWAELIDGHAAVLASGITCALGTGPAAAVGALFEAARGSRIQTVFDVNFRARLWAWDEAAPVLRDLLERVDVLLASRHDLEELLGVDGGDQTELARRALDTFGHELVVLRETHGLPGAAVAVTVTAIAAGEERTSPTYEAAVVDAFGAGDAALGALLASRLSGEDLATAIDAAAWACAFQHTTPGDAWQGRASDLEQRVLSGRRVLR